MPAFNGLLNAMDGPAQDEGVEKLQHQIKSIVQAADEEAGVLLGSSYWSRLKCLS